jgi:hypothetical protein
MQATADRYTTLATLARKAMLTPAQAVALPTVVEVAALRLGKTEDWIVAECYHNAPVLSYLASLCRKVTA